MRGGSSFHVAHSAGVAAGHLLPWFYVNKVSAAPAPRQRQQYRNWAAAMFRLHCAARSPAAVLTAPTIPSAQSAQRWSTTLTW